MSTLKRVKHAKPVEVDTPESTVQESTSTVNHSVEIVPFMCEIPEETRKLLELKYIVYPLAGEDNQWSYTIVDNSHKKSTVRGIQSTLTTTLNNTTTQTSQTSQTQVDRLKLQAINAAIASIYNTHDTSIHQHINVEVHTDSVYCTNALREWMYKWVESNFVNRPNGDLLHQSYLTILPYKDNIKLCWQPTKVIALAV